MVWKGAVGPGPDNGEKRTRPLGGKRIADDLRHLTLGHAGLHFGPGDLQCTVGNGRVCLQLGDLIRILALTQRAHRGAGE